MAAKSTVIGFLISSFIFRHSWRISKCVFGLADFTTRYARGTEHTEVDYSFPLRETTAKEKQLPIDAKHGNELSWLPAGLRHLSDRRLPRQDGMTDRII